MLIEICKQLRRKVSAVIPQESQTRETEKRIQDYVPLIVSKLVSRKPSCLDRNSRSFSATSTSVKMTPVLISSSSHAQNWARAAASLQKVPHT